MSLPGYLQRMANTPLSLSSATKPSPDCSSESAQLQGLYKSIWALNIPPKLKHFWWRILHNEIPVAANLASRRIKIPQDCLFCVDAAETTMHLFFQCRLAREIWALSPLQIPSGQYEEASSLYDIVTGLLSSQAAHHSKEFLFPYIGWCIWKARNDLLYNNKQWAIPDIIHQALMDFKLWREAQNVSTPQISHQANRIASKDLPSYQSLPSNSLLYCYTDGSWIGSNSKAGIGWALHNAQGQCLLKGSSSIEPANSAVETEAIALREALLQMKRLNYDSVVFCGDSLMLYGHLEKTARQCQPMLGPLEIQVY